MRARRTLLWGVLLAILADALILPRGVPRQGNTRSRATLLGCSAMRSYGVLCSPMFSRLRIQYLRRRGQDKLTTGSRKTGGGEVKISGRRGSLAAVSAMADTMLGMDNVPAIRRCFRFGLRTLLAVGTLKSLLKSCADLIFC